MQFNSTSNDTVNTDFQLNVPHNLVREVPEEAREDPDKLADYLLRALEVGLMALGQAGLNLETGFVKAEFQAFTSRLSQIREGIEKLMADELTDEDSKLATRLRDYLSDDGHLSRTVKALSQELGDPSREGSIPGRIRKILDDNFKNADSPFQRALNIADDSSPLKKFVSNQDEKLDKINEDLTKKHTELAKALEASFEKVFNHIGYKEQLAESEAAGTRKGGVFEDDLVEFLQSISIGKDHAERVGSVTVDGTQVKRGDALINVEQEGFDKIRIVIEAKRGGYTLKGKDGVLKQLEDAIEYRDAAAGIVVVTREHAGVRQKTFDRIGSNKIVVVVDPDDENGGFLPLEVAYPVLREVILAVKKEETTEGPDLAAAESAISQIQTALGMVSSMKRGCTEAVKNIDNVKQSITDLEIKIRDNVAELRRNLAVQTL